MRRITFLIWILGMTCAAEEVEIDGRRFQIPDGFGLERVAGPPLVDRPITASFDEQGRLYVADSSGSNEKVEIQLEKRPHRIVRLEDRNGDGKYDQSVVFADRMMFPEGTLWHNGSLYVAAPPSIWRLTDTDEDGVADQREEWFQGKTLTGCANDLHGPYLGPDGWIYWCKGAFASQTYQRADGSSWETRAAHIFRRHPAGGVVEPVMTGGMDNPVDVVFTPGGERIFTTTFLRHPRGGKRDGLIHAIYGGLYGKVHSVIEGHPRSGELLSPLVHLGAAAPCGFERLASDQFGETYRHNLVAALFNMRKVTRHALSKSGATFESVNDDFLVTDDMDFHPTDVIEDADGSLLVIDTGGWYKLCCPTSQLEKPDVLGNIYRVRRRGAHRIDDPRGLDLNWGKLHAGELIGLLGDARPAVRRRAQSRLAAIGTRDVVTRLSEVIDESPRPATRLHAVWTLCRIDGETARAAPRKALADSDSDVRQAAAHAASLHRDADAVDALLRLLAGDDWHSRRVAAEALGRIGDPRAVPGLLAAAGRKLDRTLEHSLIFALIEINNPGETREAIDHANAATRKVALIAVDQMESGDLSFAEIDSLFACDEERLRSTAWWLVERHPEWARQLVGFFRERIGESKSASLLRSRLPGLLADEALRQLVGHSVGDAGVDREVRIALLDAIVQSSIKEWPEAWTGSLLRVLESADARLVAGAIAAVHALGDTKPDPAVAARLLRVSRDTLHQENTRLKALAVVARLGKPLDLSTIEYVCQNLPSDCSPEGRHLAVEVLSKSPLDDAALSVLIEVIPRTGPMELTQLLDVFRQTRDAKIGLALITALRRCPAASAVPVGRLTECLNRFSGPISSHLNGLIAWHEASNAQRVAQMEQVATLLETADIRRGQLVFNSSKASCRACHEMGYLGGTVGPDLTRIGRIRTERDLLEAILFPSQSFVRSYEPVVIVTSAGRSVSGLVRDETGEEVILALDAQKELRIRHEEIELRRPGTVSIMPAGLEKQLSPRELADLVKFLHAAR